MTCDIWYIDEGFLVWIILSTYLSHEAINWVCTASFAIFAFIGFYFRFLILLLFISIIIYVYILAYHLCSIPPVSCSYHIISCIFPSWYHLLSLYLLMYACTHDTIFSTSSFDSDLSIHVCLSLHATWHLPHHSLGSFWLLWILMSKF